MSHDVIVVGSGPAGVAAASALARRGRRVTLLDGGLRLEPHRESAVAALAGTAPQQWSPRELDLIKEGMEPGAEGIPLKRLFGSDFAFRDTERYAEIVCRNSDIKMSLAMGGLSNVWGAGAVPFCAEDIADWPLKIEELAPYYRECLEEMQLAAVPDDLAGDYPLHTDRARPLRQSRQAAAFTARLTRHRAALSRQGIAFGGSRLAVKAGGGGNGPHTAKDGCVYCGLCLYGCPYGHIYNSSDALRDLLREKPIAYVPDLVVRRVEESGQGVTVHATGRADGANRTFAASRVFLACGPIPTTGILLESLGAWDTPLRMQDSQYFLCPAVSFSGTTGVDREPLHTLAQLFLEIRDPAVSQKGIHISVYTYNDLLLEALRKQTGPVGKVWRGLPLALAGRMLVFGGYLHSLESPSIEFTLARTKSGGGQIILRGLPRPESARIVNRLILKLARNSLRMGAVPVVPFARKGLPGRGFHAGGTFPMSERPARFQSDLLGVPHGFTRVHAVDATVFPSIPAPNLTLSVMANARRIAAAVA